MSSDEGELNQMRELAIFSLLNSFFSTLLLFIKIKQLYDYRCSQAWGTPGDNLHSKQRRKWTTDS